jgi:hypothetical protein
MTFDTDVIVLSVFPEVKHIELFKNSDEPWSYNVRELLSKEKISPRMYVNLKDDLEELSSKENFVYEIHDGWGELEC